MGRKFFCFTFEMFTQHSFPKNPSGKVSKGFGKDYKIMLFRISSEAVTKPRTALENGKKSKIFVMQC